MTVGVGRLKAFAFNSRSTPGRGRQPPGIEDVSRPLWLTRQVVSRPARVG